MSKLGAPIDLTEWLASDRKLRNRVFQVGLELEGAWHTLPKGVRLQRDGSLDGFAAQIAVEGQLQIPPRPWQVGELPSPPLSMKEEDATFWKTWLRTMYPHRVSPACGLHIHMSFLNAFIYQRLMHPSYPATILKYMKEWATQAALPPDNPLWTRLEGKSKYCKHQFFADMQAATTQKDYNQEREGHRYTVINYCYSRNHTAECRLLPMFDTADLALSALAEIIKVTNTFLVATAAREGKVVKTLEIGGVSRVDRRDGRVVYDDPDRYREVRRVEV